MTSHEYADQHPTISYDTALKLVSHHLSDPRAELDAAIRQGDVVQAWHRRVDTKSLITWLGY